MGARIESWEQSVLTKAYQALNTPIADTFSPVERRSRKEAFKYCERLIKYNSHTFYLASSLLPRHKRMGVRALYAFCRATDDLIDQTSCAADAHALLENWRARLAQYPNVYDPVLLAWADTRARYQIPHGYEIQLIEGITRDLRQRRYATFAELAEYCYGVASTVGLMVMHIIRFRGEAALPYAVKLGIALQLTNILRDVGADWKVGRLYLPLDELARFGVTEADIARGVVDERWRALMRFQINRARGLYAEAKPGIALLDPEGRFAITAAAELYRAILEDIETSDYDVFRRRAHVGRWSKIRRLPGIWRTTHTLAESGEKRKTVVRTGDIPVTQGDERWRELSL